MNEFVPKFPLINLMCLLDKISRFLSAEEKTLLYTFVMLALRNRAPAAATNEPFKNKN